MNSTALNLVPNDFYSFSHAINMIEILVAAHRHISAVSSYSYSTHLLRCVVVNGLRMPKVCSNEYSTVWCTGFKRGT